MQKASKVESAERILNEFWDYSYSTNCDWLFSNVNKHVVTDINRVFSIWAVSRVKGILYSLYQVWSKTKGLPKKIVPCLLY